MCHQVIIHTHRKKKHVKKVVFEDFKGSAEVAKNEKLQNRRVVNQIKLINEKQLSDYRYSSVSMFTGLPRLTIKV